MSPVKMGVDPEKIKQAKVQPNGWYKLKFVGFRPKRSQKDKDSINFNGQFEVLNSAGPDFQKNVYAIMSDKMQKHINDIVHGLGFPLEADGSIPGTWIFDPKEPENVEKAQYKGPLMGRTMEAELGTTTYQGNDRNEIRQVRCVVTDCASKYPDIRHQTNMIGKNK
jgi:hypothetical protein